MVVSTSETSAEIIMNSCRTLSFSLFCFRRIRVRLAHTQ